MRATGHKTRKMRNIHQKKRPDFIGNGPETGKIPMPRIARPAGNDEFGLVLERQSLDLRLEHYSAGGGEISAGFYRKQIRNFFATRNFLATPEFLQLYDLDPPFIIASDPLPLSQWIRRTERSLPLLKDGDILSGLGGGAGRYTGRVCVLQDPSDMAKLEPGDVLVAPFTDAAWTPLFLIAGAVVVDVGAMNSHAVVVSRELGIPSVLSVTTGTAQLSDGMEVTVDGVAGTVTVVSTAGAATV